MIGNWCSVDSLAHPPEVIFGCDPSSERVNAGFSSTSSGSWNATAEPGGSCDACRPKPPSPGFPWSVLTASADAAPVSATKPPTPSAVVPKKLRLLLSIGLFSPRLLTLLRLI